MIRTVSLALALAAVAAYARGDAISPFPLDVIVDARGRVAYVSRTYDGAAMRAVIDRLLAPDPAAE